MSARDGRRRGRLLASTFLALVAALVGALGAVGAGTATAQERDTGPDEGSVRRVLVVTLPRTTWERLDAGPTPELRAFLDRAAVASMSPRTVGPVTDPGRAYLTIGAGNRASSEDPFTDGEAADIGEQTPSGPASAVFERRTGVSPDGRVLALTFPEQVARNEELLYGTVPGAFGQALSDSGRELGAVGNAGQFQEDLTRRHVALAAADGDGQVATGTVGADLLVEDPLAPFGVRTDPERVLEAVRGIWDAGAEVAVVEMSDLERAEQARVQSTAEQGDEQFDRALADADALFTELLGTVDEEQDVVMVLGPTAPLSAEQLTVFGMTGPGVGPGWARSSTTRRDGFVTLTDVAPTVLGIYGVEVPDSMNDTPMSVTTADGDAGGRIDRMIRDNERALFRDEATGPLTVAFIVLLVVLLLLVAWTLGRANGWAGPVRYLALVVMSVPACMYLAGLLPYGPFGTVTYGLVVLAGSALVALVAHLLGRHEAQVAPLVPSMLAILVLAADVATGATLQLNTMFGYSPIVAGRFAGFGNQAYAIISISTLIAATAGWEVSARSRPGSSDRPRLVAVIVLFVAVIVVDGAPSLGSDVGGVLAMVPAFTVCTLLLAGRRIRARLVVVIGVATVAVLGLFALVDLSRPAESRTHLGRFAQRVLDGDALVILQRKLEANVNILTSTAWTIVIPAALLFLAYLTWRPNRGLQRINAEHPSFRPFGISAIVLGLLSWAVNDSGVAIPAMMLTIALPYTAYLVLSTLLPRRSGTERDRGGPVADGASGSGGPAADDEEPSWSRA